MGAKGITVRDARLVCYSYGAVIIETGNDPKVMVGLGYIAAFGPDSGESIETLIKNSPAEILSEANNAPVTS